MFATLKKLSAVTLAGAIIGMLVASLIGPRFIAWYMTPGSQGQALCDLPKLTASIVSQLFEWQLIGAIVGAVLFLVIGVVIIRSRRNAARPGLPDGTATPPAAAP